MLRLAIILTLASQYVSSHSCDLGWEMFRGRCYVFGEEAITWGDAAGVCLVYGGHLVEILDAELNQWIVNRINSTSFGSVWTGGSKRFHRGTWEWVGTKRRFDYQNWGRGEPNSRTEDCLEVLGPPTFKWNDVGCLEPRKYLCEKVC